MRIFLVLLIMMVPAYAAPSGEAVSVLPDEKTAKKDPYRPMELERVKDGDTFFASGVEIRIWGIQAPERHQALYAISTKALELFLERGELRCKFLYYDINKREVCHCYSGETDIGSLMVKTGFARDFQKYSNGFYNQEEQFAREGKLNIWE